MLHCTMTNTLAIQLSLEDLLADLHFARRCEDLGRLALLAYCEVKTWSRMAGKTDLAENAIQLILGTPCLSKQEFLDRIDQLIATLEGHQQAYERTLRRNQFAKESSSLGIPNLRH